MPGRRRSPRFATWIALAAVLLSMFPPAWAHSLGAPATFGADSDYCSTVGAKDAAPALPSPADHRARSHCDGCTGTAGNGGVLTGTMVYAVARHSPSPAVVTVDTPVPAPADLIAAPPRGPPHSA
jgi:hypothetical protein